MDRSRVWLFTAGLLFCSTSQAHAKDVIVEIYKKQFIPSEITIEAGDRVIWKNIEKRQYHSVWFKGSGEEEPITFFLMKATNVNLNSQVVLLMNVAPS